MGHDVSAFLKEYLPKTLSKEIESRPNAKRKKVIDEIFNYINSKLFNESKLDSNFSGSTCVTVIFERNKLICANAGDSRAILGSYKRGSWISTSLSNDHKPTNREEANRIVRRGGRIESLKDNFGKPYGPERIWIKSENIPGLAMTRSFGDKIAASVGVICEPGIIWCLNKK